jgi:hypothetical protein
VEELSEWLRELAVEKRVIRDGAGRCRKKYTLSLTALRFGLVGHFRASMAFLWLDL